VPIELIDEYDCYCIHPSDLPKYRGGSPIQNQIIDGVKDSAVTLFKMDYDLDLESDRLGDRLDEEGGRYSKAG